MTAAKIGLYGLVGHPVAHSRSPMIHRRFADQTGRDMEYVLLDVGPGEFHGDVRTFRERGGKGLNVTLPHKGEACAFASCLTERARTAQAVNTLTWLPDGTTRGDNTDGAGLITDLRRNLGVELSGRRILLMGAGGAARGAIAPLLACKPAQLVVANRTVGRAEALAEAFTRTGPVAASTYQALDGRFDLLVNATSASLVGAVPPIPDAVLSDDSLCYDMYYTVGQTAFLRWAAGSGCPRLADGTGMLVEQAAETFEIWHDVRPETSAVLDEIRCELARAQQAPR